MRRRARYLVGQKVVEEAGVLRARPTPGGRARRDSGARVREVAAGLHVLGIVLAPRPESPQGFVDRAIVAARAAGIEPFLVVNKMDLEGAGALCASLRELYGDDLLVLPTSAAMSEGLEAIESHLARPPADDARVKPLEGRRGAFIGTSGVGKSSLLNELCEGLDLATGEINEASGLGRHVTSNATLHTLRGGGELVDTPGFRDFGPMRVSARELADHFPGFEGALDGGCRFRDCMHRREPGCAVLTAVEAEEIPAHRHAAYVDLLDELEAAERDARRY